MKRLGILVIVVLACLLYQCEQKPLEPSLPMQILLDFVNENKTPEKRETAKKDLERGFRQIPSPNALDRFYYYDFECWYNLEENRLAQALLYADSLKETTSELDEAHGLMAHAYKTRGEVLSRMHNYSEALKELYAADVIASRYLDSCASAELFSNLGTVLYEQGDYRQALAYYKKARATASNCGGENNNQAFMLTQRTSNAQGLCYGRLDLPDSARYYFYEALNLLENRRNQFPGDSSLILAASGKVLENLGDAEMKAGNWVKAEAHFLASISSHIRAGKGKNAAMEAELQLAKMFVLQKEYIKAAEVFGKIREQLALSPFPDLERDLLLIESNFYEAVSRPEPAFLAYKEHVRMRDSLQLMKGEWVYALPVAPPARGLLNVEKSGLTGQDELESIYLKGSLILLFVLLVVIYLIRRNLVESREHVGNLNQLNTEIKEQNSQLHTAMQALENSFEENERVMRIVSHDLRNPVGSIVSLALLLKANENLDDGAKEYSNMIHSLSKDVLGFMEEVLNLKTSLEVVDKSKEDLFELLSYCISFMEFKAQEKGQTISLSGQSVAVMVSREKIWRVFINILSNAIKFSPESKSIEVYLEGDETRALVSFTDHGIGIPEELKDKVFDMLTEAKRNGTAGEKAHGLGMAISKQIMEAHGGKIWLESIEGQGTTFFLEFPREGMGAVAKEKQKSKPKEQKGPRYSAKLV